MCLVGKTAAGMSTPLTPFSVCSWCPAFRSYMAKTLEIVVGRDNTFGRRCKHLHTERGGVGLTNKQRALVTTSNFPNSLRYRGCGKKPSLRNGRVRPATLIQQDKQVHEFRSARPAGQQQRCAHGPTKRFNKWGRTRSPAHLGYSMRTPFVSVEFTLEVPILASDFLPNMVLKPSCKRLTPWCRDRK
jgi:hypothetical protein